MKKSAPRTKPAATSAAAPDVVTAVATAAASAAASDAAPNAAPDAAAVAPATPSASLATFPNPNPERDYLVRIEIPEFTCLCPITGQPDFARFELEFVPNRRNVELKSLKLYVFSYRNQGAFHEAVTNRVLDDLVAAMAPRFLRITARWNVRGGIYTTVAVEHRKRGWEPAATVDLGPASVPTLPMPFSTGAIDLGLSAAAAGASSAPAASPARRRAGRGR